MKLVKKAQIDEEQGAILYEFMAKKEKNEENKKILMQMAKDEKKHAEVWKSITQKDLKPNVLSILKFKFLTIVMGITFVIKTMQKKENLAQHEYEKMMKDYQEYNGKMTEEKMMDTMESVSNVVANTQWTVVFNTKELTATYCYYGDYEKKYSFSIK